MCHLLLFSVGVVDGGLYTLQPSPSCSSLLPLAAAVLRHIMNDGLHALAKTVEVLVLGSVYVCGLATSK
jgi:hypothetical protein